MRAEQKGDAQAAGDGSGDLGRRKGWIKEGESWRSQQSLTGEILLPIEDGGFLLHPSGSTHPGVTLAVASPRSVCPRPSLNPQMKSNEINPLG